MFAMPPSLRVLEGNQVDVCSEELTGDLLWPLRE
jgi:hypothetical protein